MAQQFCCDTFQLHWTTSTRFFEHFSKAKKKKISVPQPQMIKLYSNTMSGVDLIDAAVATYRIKFKGKKWCWAHFTNTLDVFLGTVWRIFCVTNQDEDQSLFYFLCSVVVQSYLHIDKISATKKKVDDNICLTGWGLWPNTIESQRHCQFPSCKSKVRTVSETCGVVLCIKNAHFKPYNTTK